MTKNNEVSQTETQIEVIREKVNGMQAMIDSSPVTNDEQLAQVADKVKNVKTLGKFIESVKEKYVGPAKEIIAAARGMYDPAIDECKKAEKTLKDRARDYMVAKDKADAEAKAKIAKRVENGTMKPETAMKKMEAMPEVQNTVRTDTGSGLRTSKYKVAKITDTSIIPDEFWVVDEVRVKREALDREKYGKDPIPGVEVIEETRVSSV